MASDDEYNVDGSQAEGENEETTVIRELSLGDMPGGLSLLSKIDDGLAHAYTKLTASNKGMTSIDLVAKYGHLRFVDFSRNQINDFSPLENLKSLLWVKLNDNKSTTARLDTLPYLQVLDMSNNLIHSILGIEHPLLEQLNLNNNKITSCEGLDQDCLTNLETLQLRSNMLTNTSGLENFKNLKFLFIGNNQITSLVGICHLDNLEILHARENQIKELGDAFVDGKLQHLKYINFRANSITSLDEIKKLSVLPSLEALVLLENAIIDEEDYRLEVLIRCRRLNRLDKDPYDDDERDQCQERIEVLEIQAREQAEN